MAVQPIQVTGTIAYVNTATTPSLSASLGETGLYVAITGTKYVQGVFNVPTTAGGTAIPVSNLANLGWFMIINTDPTNYVEIYTAVSGSAFLKLLPGDFAMGRFDPAVTAPAAKANTAAVNIEYIVLEN